ncbi:MAG: transcription antitermination factor NusB [Clostridia bacterium]|nr:transcription antitermination factor NusB [Clostridia bacterium]
MSRRLARDSAYKLVFEYLFNGGQVPSVSYDLLQADVEFSQADQDYIKQVYEGVKSHYDELISMISGNTTNFNSIRIFKADLAALLVATYEMKYIHDIPYSVSISEIIDLVKCYSTENSSAFVNGVLAGVYKQLEGVKKDGDN